jgi:anti-sigma B factor antagonist
MDINVTTIKQIAVVRLDGRIDGRTAAELQDRILPLIQPGSKIVLDMTDVTYMSSAGLRLLVLTYRQVADSDGDLVLAVLSEKIRDTMSITGFLPYFTVYDTVEAALAALA